MMAPDDQFARLLVEGSPDALCVLTEAARIAFWNPGAAEVFGYTRDEAIGRSIFDLLVPADHLEETQRHLEQTIQTDSTASESVRRRKDGTLVYVDVTTRAVRDALGRVEFIIVSHQDVTVSRSLREATRIQGSFGALLESVPDAIVIVNPPGRLVLVNTHTERLFGYRRDDLLGTPIELLVPERLRTVHTRHRIGYFADPCPRSMGSGLKLYGLRRDGTEFPVEISLSSMETEEGLVTAAIRDLSDQERLSMQLERQAR
jgi:protein-histidine pros-kinase